MLGTCWVNGLLSELPNKWTRAGVFETLRHACTKKKMFSDPHKHNWVAGTLTRPHACNCRIA